MSTLWKGTWNGNFRSPENFWTFSMRRRLARMVLSCSLMIIAKNTLLNAFGLSCGQRDLFSAFASEHRSPVALFKYVFDQLCDQGDYVSAFHPDTTASLHVECVIAVRRNWIALFFPAWCPHGMLHFNDVLTCFADCHLDLPTWFVLIVCHQIFWSRKHWPLCPFAKDENGGSWAVREGGSSSRACPSRNLPRKVRVADWFMRIRYLSCDTVKPYKVPKQSWQILCVKIKFANNLLFKRRRLGVDCTLRWRFVDSERDGNRCSRSWTFLFLRLMQR